MHVGILQCGHTPEAVAEEQGEYADMFRRLLGGHGFRFTTWNVVDMEFPDGPTSADAWLISGSRHGVYEGHAFIPPLEDLIRAIYASGRQMVGICFGHQIIAQALGGMVEKFAGGWSVGGRTYLFDTLGPVRLNSYHQDQVIVPPEAARTVAHSDFCRYAALAYGDHVLTLQAHPEFSTAVIKRYLEVRGDDPMYPREIIADARAHQDDPVDDARIGAIIADVLMGKPTPLTQETT